MKNVYADPSEVFDTILNDDEIEIYRKIFNIFTEGIPKADLVVYLQISFSEMMKRIKSTGTDFEKRVPQEYWREIFEAYNYYFFNLRNCPLLVVNMEKIDLNNRESLAGLMKEIKKHEAGIKYYGPA
jgi:deoxyadenosine/deoxycytidine kinase